MLPNGGAEGRAGRGCGAGYRGAEAAPVAGALRPTLPVYFAVMLLFQVSR
jgi:hypothetical protein